MIKTRWALSCLLPVFALGCLGQQEQPALTVEALNPDAVFEYDEQTGTVTSPTGVVVKYGDAELTATKVTLNRQNAEVTAAGNVRLQRGQELWVGETIRYNFANGRIQSDIFKAGMPPFFASGHGLQADVTNRTYSATNSFITTDDVAKPLFKVRAKHLKIIPGERIEARSATVYLGKIPIWHIPKYRRNLYRHPNNFVFRPGYRSLFGPYLLGTYNWTASTNLEGAINLDYREKRGVGGGADLRYDLGAAGAGSVTSYITDDQDPRTDVLGREIREDRYRVGFGHAAQWHSNLTARLVVNWQSDAYITRDFFEAQYRRDPQPKSFLEVNQLWPNFSLNVLAQPRFNDFFQTVERLPDVKLSAFRQQLGVSPFYYEGENSVGYLRFRWAEDRGTNYAAWRADTFHQIVLPQTFFGWLNVTPRVGGRFTHYGEEEGRGSTFEALNRGVFNTGAEVSTKASRVWPGAHSKLWDVNGLRHILEPSVNYVYVPSPNLEPRQLPQFDTELPSLRLLPIDFPDYYAIDSVDSQNTLRFGLRNKLQTKRRLGLDQLLDWAVYMDWRLRPREPQDTFSDLYTDLDLKPRSWLTLNSEARFDLHEGACRLATHMATLEPGSRWRWRVGHRYLSREAGYGLGNNLILSSFTYRFSENWAFRLSHHFEARDGTLEEQSYTLYRDLRSWTTALTFRVRDSRGARPEDLTVALTFSFKAFPRYRLNQDLHEPWSLQ